MHFVVRRGLYAEKKYVNRPANDGAPASIYIYNDDTCLPFCFDRASVLRGRQAIHLPRRVPHHSLRQGQWRLLRLSRRLGRTRCVPSVTLALAFWLARGDPRRDWPSPLFARSPFPFCRNRCVSQRQLPLHQRRFPADVHPFLPRQRWNMRYDCEPAFLSFFPVCRPIRICSDALRCFFLQYPDCCDTTDEYNSGATCQNTCR